MIFCYHHTHPITVLSDPLTFYPIPQLEEYLGHPWVNDMNKFFAQRFIESRKKGVQLEASSEFHPFLQRKITVYSISHKSKTDSESGKDKTGSDNFSCNGDPKL